MDLSIVAKVCLDGRHDSPTAVGSVLKMLHDRIVILFPPSERLAAEKAFHTIGAPVERVEEEAGFRKLEGACRVSAGQSITTVGIEAHIDWRQPFVRPMQRLGSARARVGRPTFPSGELRALKRRQAVLIGKVSVAASGHGHCCGHCRGATPADRGSGGGGFAKTRSRSRGGGREMSIGMLRTSRPCPKKMETKNNAESPGLWCIVRRKGWC